VLPFISPYLQYARGGATTTSPEGHGGGLVVDVGCGSSSMGIDLSERFQFDNLLLTDIDNGGAPDRV